MNRAKGMSGAMAKSALILVVMVLFPTLALAQGNAEKGEVVYEKRCAVCHGAEGKGNGPGAALLSPKPRDFTRGAFKVRSTTTLPTDSDLRRVITEGIPGTSMRSWAYLSEGDRRNLVEFVKSFSRRFTEQPAGPPVQIPKPPPSSEELLALGRHYYREAGCFDCHGDTGKGDGPAAPTLKDEWGDPILAYDFTIPGRMKGGSRIEDIYRTLTVGIGGTPMPSYADSLGERERWALGYYVLSLVGKPAPAPPTQVVGAQTCKVCHQDQFERFSATTMGKLFLKHPRNDKERLGCEGCHGAGSAHLAEGVRLLAFRRGDLQTVPEQNAACLQCHEKTARLYWRGSPHALRNVACTDCHRVMEQISDRNQLAKMTEIETCGQCHPQRRAQTMRSSHMPLREGKMTCSSCHNPHGTASEKLLKANSVNENCYSCHAEKRGPFLWEHAPVVESCSNCHEPHGTNHEKLLKIFRPRLCQSCHVVTRHRTEPFTRTNFRVFNRSCANCHNGMIHGTNHPSGDRKFQR